MGEEFYKKHWTNIMESQGNQELLFLTLFKIQL